ncbi:MAG: membrane protein insertion efficiency factor YidD [Oscillospiraceae bacterium]|nr:membrane protein insertion efficiency factor YidD [Oscillospiraceae bacterium]MDD4369093.1 membrane protein insertion efficiency factor YidD [Oscillospiraceae bacterium]
MKKLMIRMIRFYQRSISPLLGPSCRFIPTCSEYAVEAIQKYGAIKGGAKALWRILRCNPFSKGGYDPVDSPLSDHKEKL